jgi:hypothetical protein
MFVSNYTFLVRDGHHDMSIFFQNNTLASQATFQTWIDGAINKVFFFIGYFLYDIVTLFNVDMAGGTSTHATAVVVEVDICFFCNFENGLILKIATDRFFRNGSIFKLKCNCYHNDCASKSRKSKTRFYSTSFLT